MAMMANVPETVAIDLAADRLGVSSWTFRTWLRQGRLPYFKVGRRVLVKADDIEALLVQNYRPAARSTVIALPAKAPTKRRARA